MPPATHSIFYHTVPHWPVSLFSVASRQDHPPWKVSPLTQGMEGLFCSHPPQGDPRLTKSVWISKKDDVCRRGSKCIPGGWGGRLQYFKCFKLQHFGDIFKDPERPGCKLLGKKFFFFKQNLYFSVSFLVPVCFMIRDPDMMKEACSELIF